MCGVLEAAPAAPPVHDSLSDSLSPVVQPYLKSKFICFSSLDHIGPSPLEYLFDMQPNIEASALKLPPSPGIMFSASVGASHHKLLQDPPPSCKSMEFLSLTHSRPPPPGGMMHAPCSMSDRLPPATNLDTSVPSFENYFCGSPRRMSKAMSLRRTPRPPPPPPPASTRKSASFSMSDRGLLAPPLPAASVSFGQPKTCKLAIGVPNAIAYGSAPAILRETIEPVDLECSAFSAFSFGASQQQQKRSAFSAPGKLNHIEFPYLINVQMD